MESGLSDGLKVSESNSVLITEITEDKGTLQLRDTEQNSSLNVAISHGVLIVLQNSLKYLFLLLTYF